MGTAFITGAVRNTGLAIAEKFASEGFNVAVSSRNLEDAVKVAKDISENYGVHAEGYSLDLTDVQDIRRVFAQIKSDFGELDTFVANSANLGIGHDFLNVSETDFDDLMNVNVRGTFFCCQQAALLMKNQNKGSIVLIGSVHGKAAVFGRSTYSTSKGALCSLVRSMAVELGCYNIRANIILAGAIRTNRWDGISDEEVAKRRENWPLGIESTGEDIANGAFYLGSDLSRTVTGTELTIDSGILSTLLAYKGGKH